MHTLSVINSAKLWRTDQRGSKSTPENSAIGVKSFNKVLRMNKFGRGGGDRNCIPIKQVLNRQRRSATARIPIGVKWCQAFPDSSFQEAAKPAKTEILRNLAETQSGEAD